MVYIKGRRRSFLVLWSESDSGPSLLCPPLATFLTCRLSTCCCCSVSDYLIYMYRQRYIIVSPLRASIDFDLLTVGWSLQLLRVKFSWRCLYTSWSKSIKSCWIFWRRLHLLLCSQIFGIIERHNFCRWWRRPAANILSSLVWSSRSHCHITPFVAACALTFVGAGCYYWRRRASFFLFFDCYIAPMLSRQFSYIKCRLGDARSTRQ